MVEWYWQGERRSRRKTCPSATLSTTTNPIWTEPGENLGLPGEKTATKYLSYSTALPFITFSFTFTLMVSEIDNTV
jgi:hypothetical protein